MAIEETTEHMEKRKKIGTLFDTLFEDGELRSYIDNNTVDPWVTLIGGRFEKYVGMSPKQKGEFGERVVSKLAELEGLEVKPAHSSTAGYDRIINGKKVEIKFSLATRTKKKQKATGYMSLTKKELSNILRERELKPTGNKPDLVSRLEDWDESHPEEARHACLIEETDDFGVKTDSFVINHVSKDKDWEYLVFCGINPKESDMRLIWFSNEDFKTHVETSCFNTQQGGKKIANDDYMCTDFNYFTKLRLGSRRLLNIYKYKN